VSTPTNDAKRSSDDGKRITELLDSDEATAGISRDAPTDVSKGADDGLETASWTKTFIYRLRIFSR